MNQPHPSGVPPRAAVLGAGTMGRGIAQLLAQAGSEVALFDPSDDALEAARNALDGVFAMLEGKGRLPQGAASVSARIHTTNDLGELRAPDWVLEAAPESLDIKRALFARAAEACPEARLATNTSTLSVTAIAAATPRPANVVGMHFFNPAPLMRLVEVVPGIDTAPEVTEAAMALARGLGRTPVQARDRPGFIVNRVARPFYGEALRLAGEGVDVGAIDRAMRAVGFRMGPFELLDLIGLDVNLAATRSVFQAFFQEPRYRPHPLQQALVDAGRLGRKRGRGFYRYEGGSGREGGDGGGPGPAPPPAWVAPPVAASPRPVVVLGDGAPARALRGRLHTTEDASAAHALLDARVAVEAARAPDALAALPLARLCWGQSASLARARAGRPLVGFSLGPPLAEVPVVELMVPEGQGEAELRALEGLLAEHGIATLALPDRAGGVAFRELALLINEAVSALAEGLASADAIDTAMELGTNYPRGPLAWAETLGLADVERALRALHAELGAERFAPQPLLTRLAAVGATAFAGRS